MSAGPIVAAAIPALAAMLERLIREGFLDPRAVGPLGERHPELLPELPRLRIAAYETAKLRATARVKGSAEAAAQFSELRASGLASRSDADEVLGRAPQHPAAGEVYPEDDDGA